jgi:hypothetical protein
MNNIITTYHLDNRDIHDLIIVVYLVSLIFGCVYGLKLFDNNYFKLFLFLLVIYCYENNKIVGIIIALIIFLIYQYIIKHKIDNYTTISGVKMINSDYDDKPLLNATQINEDKEDLNLITPEQKHLNMIASGEALLNDAEELQNDVNLLYDSREQNIVDTTKYNALININTGKNYFEGDILKTNTTQDLKDLQREYDKIMKANTYNDLL